MLLHYLQVLCNSPYTVPLQITQQGQMVDSAGTTVVGTHNVTFRLYNEESSNSPLWTLRIVIVTVILGIKGDNLIEILLG